MHNNDTQALLQELEGILSEGRNPATMDLDTLATTELLQRINAQDALVASAVQQAIPYISQAVDVIYERLAGGGRLFYIGAGTSGRLGILDAVECRPTFSVDDTLVQGIIAGGERAIQHAVEGAEDNAEAGKNDLLARKLTPQDAVVGLSASGRTPYVLGALNYANEVGAYSIAIACNPQAPILTVGKCPICVATGPECLTGSTRMKAGSAQKMVLNMLSTATMIKLGKVYQNLMVDVNASNAKLNARAIRIVMQATDCDQRTAQQALSEAGQRAKVAILMVLTGMDASSAEAQLARQHGFLRKAMSQHD